MGNIPSINLNSKYFKIDADRLDVDCLASTAEKKKGIRFSRCYLNQFVDDLCDMDQHDINVHQISVLVDYQTWTNNSDHQWVRNYISMPLDQDLPNYKFASHLGNFAFLYLNCKNEELKDLAHERYLKLLDTL
jgi:hypothetical protein